jgi:hypothetical protein
MMQRLVNRFGVDPKGRCAGNFVRDDPGPTPIPLNKLRFPQVPSADNPDPTPDQTPEQSLGSSPAPKLDSGSDGAIEIVQVVESSAAGQGTTADPAAIEPAAIDTVMGVDGSRNAAREAEREKFRISRFDVVTSLFMALILFIGVFVTMLFIIWITSRWEFSARAIAPLIENAAGRADHAEGLERDFEPPSAEEVEELLEPTLQETINAVTDAVSSVSATVATAQSVSESKGDSRPPGPDREGEDIVPRFDRWQLNFSAHNINEYATQLDFYKIELGAIGGNIQGVDVATNLSGSPTSRRIVSTEDEKRLYFMWTSPSPLMQFDRKLLQQAKVTLQGKRQMLKFIPPELENQLAQTELQYAKANGHQSVVEIAKTIFESRTDSNGFKFEVVSQRYR